MKTIKPKQYKANSVKKAKPVKQVTEPQEAYSGFKGQNLNELAESILKLIGEDKQKRATLVGLLVSDVATKQEFTAILNELKAMREEADRRFEAIDKRFEAADKRFEAIESVLKAMREEADRRFEASEKRFDAFEKRFEVIDERFEAIEKRFEAADKRFEAIDRKFEEFRADMDKRFEEQRQDFHLEIQALDKSLSSKIDRLGSRWGIMAEDTFSHALKEVLNKAGFEVSKWRKTDTQGEFFIRPRDAEIDILVRNGKRIAIEVKSAIGIGDIEIFERSVQFYEKSESMKMDEKIMVGMHLRRDVYEYAGKLGIKIVSEIEDVAENS